MKKVLTIAFMMAATASAALAADETAQRGGMCFTNNLRIDDANVVWNCEHLGRVTIRQIYEKGFRVVGSYPAEYGEKKLIFQFLIIEEQKR